MVAQYPTGSRDHRRLVGQWKDVRGGPPRVSNRAALAGILFVLRHGLRWRDLPLELGYGSGVTCWRRLRQWQALGVWAGVHRTLLNWLGDLGAIDGTRASLDSTSLRPHLPPLPPAGGTGLKPSQGSTRAAWTKLLILSIRWLCHSPWRRFDR
jgi:transposase